MPKQQRLRSLHTRCSIALNRAINTKKVYTDFSESKKQVYSSAIYEDATVN
jgi:hypothetical protein